MKIGLYLTLWAVFLFAMVVCSIVPLDDNRMSQLRTWAAGDAQMSAVTKQNHLWKEVLNDNGMSNQWPSAPQMFELFTESLHVTGELLSDIFPARRDKVIHCVGAVAKVAFEWDSRQVAKLGYTGLFLKADYGLVRLSSASKPTTDTLAPGMSLKFFRDKTPSANFMAMYQLDGQKSFNFFENGLCSHVAANPALGFKFQLLGKDFNKVSRWPGELGLSDFATYDQRGNKHKPHFPFALVFQANPDLTERFAGNQNPDIPGLFSKSFKQGEVLYKVYAVTEPGVQKLEYLGKLTLMSEFFGSSFADQGLFFRHQFFEEDLALRPEWANSFTQKNAEIEGIDVYAPLLPAYQKQIKKRRF